jgi:hypothetical protein
MHVSIYVVLGGQRAMMANIREYFSLANINLAFILVVGLRL